MNRFEFQKAFTLIELLIVIGILAVLATTVLLVINPAQMVKQSRDANRITEITSINQALLLYQSFGGSTNMGTHGDVYVSIPSAQANCSDLGLPALSSGSYHCSTSGNYRNIDGTGWIPVNLSSVQSSAGTLFSNLPIDPVNTVANGLYYTYIPGSWALSATLESDKYLASNAVADGGRSSTRFETGNDLSLDSAILPGLTCGDLITDADNNSYSTVLIGTQCWMTENIRTTKYPDGTAITRGPVTATWDGLDHGYYSYPPNATNSAEETLANIISNKFGFVYQWSAAMHGSTIAGAQGVCPVGWHVPTDAEQNILDQYLTDAGQTCNVSRNGTWDCSAAGTKLKSGGISGFNSTLTGYRGVTGSFGNRDAYTYFWSSDAGGSGAWARLLASIYTTVARYSYSGAWGFPVRCLKN